MSFEHTQQTLADYVLLECSGVFSVAGMPEKLDVAFEAAARAERDAVLIDIRGLDGPAPDTLQRYEMGAVVADKQRQRGQFIRIAVVGTEPMIDPERFAEVVSSNRGASARGFTDVAEARRWLEEESPFRDPAG